MFQGNYHVSIKNIHAKKKLEKIAAMASRSSLNWKKINSCNSLKISSAADVRQNYTVAHLYLTCACKYLVSSSKLYTNTLKRSKQNISARVNVTRKNFYMSLKQHHRSLQDLHKVNLTHSIQNTPTIRVKIWKSFMFQVKEDYREKPCKTECIVSTEKENRSTSQFKHCK